jgi:hypothetical protein
VFFWRGKTGELSVSDSVHFQTAAQESCIFTTTRIKRFGVACNCPRFPKSVVTVFNRPSHLFFTKSRCLATQPYSNLCQRVRRRTSRLCRCRTFAICGAVRYCPRVGITVWSISTNGAGVVAARPAISAYSPSNQCSANIRAKTAFRLPQSDAIFSGISLRDGRLHER